MLYDVTQQVFDGNFQKGNLKFASLHYEFFVIKKFVKLKRVLQYLQCLAKI